MNFELLGSTVVPDTCQHVELTQTKEPVKSAGNFHFSLMCGASCLTEIIM